MGNVKIGTFLHSMRNAIALRQYWPMWALFLILSAVDISNRFITKLDFQEGNEYFATSPGMQDISLLPNETLERYMQKLGEQTEQPEPEPIVTAEKDSNEGSQGMGFWSGADHDYQLLAIFTAVDRFSVLSRSDKEAGGNEIIEVSEGDVISDFTVSQISKHTLTLRGPDKERVDLVLFRSLKDLSLGPDSLVGD